MESDVRKKLAAMQKRQLQDIAKEIGVTGFSKLNKEDLITTLLRTPGIESAINPTWWKRYQNHVYGMASIVGTVIAVLTWAPWHNPAADSGETQHSPVVNTDSATPNATPNQQHTCHVSRNFRR